MVIFKLRHFEDWGLASENHLGKNIPGRKDRCKGPEIGKSLTFRALKGNSQGWSLLVKNSWILKLDKFRDGQ